MASPSPTSTRVEGAAAHRRAVPRRTCAPRTRTLADAPRGRARASRTRSPPRPSRTLLIALAPHLEDFLAELFGIEAEVRALEARAPRARAAVRRQAPVRPAQGDERVQGRRRGDVRRRGAARASSRRALGAGRFDGELAFAQRGDRAGSRTRPRNAAALDLALRYAAWAAHTPAGRAAHRGGVLFRAPRKLDYMQLVPVEADTRRRRARRGSSPAITLRRREGFALTDPGTDLVGALDQAHYCIWCHEQGKDSCSRGLLEKKPADGRARRPVQEERRSA